MAQDFTKTVSDLRVHVTEDNEKAISFVLAFTVTPGTGPGPPGPDTYEITIPRVIQRRLARLLDELQKNISDADDIVRDTVVDRDYRVRLQT